MQHAAQRSIIGRSASKERRFEKNDACAQWMQMSTYLFYPNFQNIYFYIKFIISTHLHTHTLYGQPTTEPISDLHSYWILYNFYMISSFKRRLTVEFKTIFFSILSSLPKMPS